MRTTSEPSRVDRQALLENALDAIISIDGEGRVIEFNPSAELTFGYSREQALGRPLGELIIPPNLREAHREGVRRVAAGGDFRLIGKRLELPALRADGTEFPAELTITKTSSDPFVVTAFVRDLTERVESERALRDSEERFARVFRQAPVGIALFDLGDGVPGRLTQVNEALCAMTRYAEDDLLGRPGRDITHPDDIATNGVLFADLLAGRVARFEVECRMVRADGSTMWALMHAGVVRAPDGTPMYGIAQLLDTTERKAAEQAVRESEARLARTQRIARIGTWDWDAVEDRLTWSDELAHVFGPAVHDSHVGREAFLATVHPDDRERLNEMIEDTLAGAPERAWEFRALIDDRVSHMYSWADVVTEDGEPVRMHGYLQDVTERRLAEERAADLERDNELILNAAGDGIFRMDRDGLATFVNPAAAKLLGYETHELIGMRVHDMIHHTNPDGTPHPPADCPAVRSAHDGEIRRLPDDVFWRKDGTPMAVDFTSAPVRVDGRPVGAVVVFSDVTERRELESQLRRLAELDPLTGLINRHRFEQLLEEELTDPRGGGALLLIDLDHFKFVNDSFGHAVGDDLIRTVSAALAEETRDGDELARLGGDEFALLVRRADPAEANAVANRLIAGIERSRPRGLSISASVGAACFEADGRATASDLLVAADIALYEAKDAGRGRVAFSSGRPGASLTWVQRIRAALADERLCVYSQPIVDLRTGKKMQEELLVRLVDERGVIVPPSAFLPTAESFGLIADIDRWVLRRGVELAAEGRRVHINLSGHSIGNTELLDDFEGWLTETGADPGNVVVELTETLAVANMAQASVFAGRLRSLGCALALDDFGTGFGAFTYLRNLPADYLKIDMAFVRDVARDEADRRVVEAIVGVAGRFGLLTIAEGVEDEETLAVLRDAGVDCAQGFLLGRPAPV